MPRRWIHPRHVGHSGSDVGPPRILPVIVDDASVKGHGRRGVEVGHGSGVGGRVGIGIGIGIGIVIGRMVRSPRRLLPAPVGVVPPAVVPVVATGAGAVTAAASAVPPHDSPGIAQPITILERHLGAVMMKGQTARGGAPEGDSPHCDAFGVRAEGEVGVRRADGAVAAFEDEVFGVEEEGGEGGELGEGALEFWLGERVDVRGGGGGGVEESLVVRWGLDEGRRKRDPMMGGIFQGEVSREGVVVDDPGCEVGKQGK